jgi:hypothetical protein
MNYPFLVSRSVGRFTSWDISWNGDSFAERRIKAMGSIFSKRESAQNTLQSLDQASGAYEYPESLTLQEHRVIEEHSPRFDVDDPQMVEYLREHGYVVVKAVASTEETSQAMKLLWEFLEDKCSMKENDPTTWTDENFAKIGDSRTGILSFSGIQHSEFLWYLRMLPKVRRIFEKIFETDDLLSSFDGGNIFRPWHLLDTAAQSQARDHPKTSAGWFHVDQGKALLGFHCVQGLVSLTDCNQQTGGFCVVPGSHLFHSEYIADTAKKSTHNFVMIPAASPLLAAPHRQVRSALLFSTDQGLP